MDAIIGKTIAIITNDEIRYVGRIAKFDGERKVISIINVSVFGSEDRIIDSSKWILPSVEIVPFLDLHGDSVKTLNIIDGDAEDVKPVLLPGMVVPTPVAPAPTPAPVEVTNAAPVNGNMNEAFDFDGNNARFEKPIFTETESYNKKSSFFDDLSSSVGGDRESEVLRWSEEKVLNEDTFGQASIGGRNRGRGRGGRGGRGNGRGRGRGNGRGRGRGGHNEQPEWAF